MAIPKRVLEQLRDGVKRYQEVLKSQRARDVSEADTVTVIKDMLADVFGYDKYADLTSEHAVRGTYCDLAVKVEGKLRLLLEVKAIGLDLKDNHIKQAVDYAANQGVEWVVLTNGVEWIVFSVVFKKPIDRQEVARFNLLELNTRSDESFEQLYMLTRDGIAKDALAEHRDRREATSRFMLAAILTTSDAVLSAVRREVRRVSDLMVDTETIAQILRDQVIKRDALEGEQADTAARRFSRASAKARSKDEVADAAPQEPLAPPPGVTPAAPPPPA